MKKINQNYRVFAYILSTMLGLIALIIFVIRPSVNYIQHVKTEIRNIESNIDQQYETTKLLRESVKRLPEIKEHIYNITNFKIQKGDELGIIQELEQLALTNDVKQSLGIQSHPENSSIVLTFSISGSLTNVFKHLQNIEHLPYYMIVYTTNWTSTDENTINLQFTATVYTN